MRYISLTPESTSNVCANCFIEFDWSGFTAQDGQVYCCTGCSEFGPCICTYGESAETGAQHTAHATGAARAAGSALAGATSAADREAVHADPQEVEKLDRSLTSLSSEIERVVDVVMNSSASQQQRALGVLSNSLLEVFDYLKETSDRLMKLEQPLPRGYLSSQASDEFTVSGETEGAALGEATPELVLEADREELAAPTAKSNGTHTSKSFELTVDSFFKARHFIPTTDEPSAPHMHSYRVEAGFLVSKEDNEGFAVGFAKIRDLIDEIAAGYNERLLNATAPFDEMPPTTENLAYIFFTQTNARISSFEMEAVRLKSIRIWESPTSSATYSGVGQDLVTA